MRVAEVLSFLRINLDVFPARQAPSAWHQMQAASIKLLLITIVIGAYVVKVLLDLLVGE